MKGFSYWFMGLNWAFRAPMRMYVLLPLIANIGIFICLFIFGATWFDAFWQGNIESVVAEFLPDWAGWLEALVIGMAFVLIFTVFWPLLSLLFGIFGAILISPFCGLLAEQTAKVHDFGADEDEYSFKHILGLIGRAINREIRKILYFIPRVILLVILGFIPVINLIMPIVWLIFGAWMLALQYADYAADNEGISFTETRKMLWQHKGDAIGLGLIIYIVAMVPVLNFIIIPISVNAGTLLWLKQVRQH